MKLRASEFAVIVIIIVSFSIGAYFYPSLPEKVASHWNMKSEVDGYVDRFWGVFLMPIISIFLFILFLILPRIDPKHKNIEKFRNYLDLFIITLFCFLLYIYVLTLAWNSGYVFDFGQLMLPGLAVLFFVTGYLVAHAEPNWTIGIRTPWTLSSEKVWKKTHILGGKLFKIASVVMLIGIFFPLCAIWFVIVPLLVIALFLVIYSYFEGKPCLRFELDNFRFHVSHHGQLSPPDRKPHFL